MPRLSRVAPAVVVALALGGVAACGSDATTSTAGSSASSSVDPHTKVSSDAEVAAGLKKMVTEADAVLAAGSDKNKAGDAGDLLHETWEGIEGTVKQAEPNIYTQIEEDLALLRDVDNDAATKESAADDLSTTVDAYLAKHPG
jgi:iron uptake system EfeUOB component EfeO/EfeM